LGVETSGPTASLALAETGAVLVEEVLDSEARHETRLGGGLRDLLSAGDCGIRDLEAIVVGLGPGSFTGVRIGVTFAKTLAFALDRPLLGLSGLLALAADTGREGPVAVLRRAHTDRVYGAAWDMGPFPPEELRPLALWDPARLLEGLPESTQVVDDGSGRWDQVIASAGLGRAAAIARVSAGTLAWLGARHLHAGVSAHDPLTLEPLYCQPSAPER
jgi:tRNA threonylcarbamoyladenosine biosynthesis protein TsaB